MSNSSNAMQAATKAARDGFNAYAVLGVAVGAKLQEIKRAWRKRALETHPDRGGDAEAFRQASLAWSILRDDAVRSFYLVLVLKRSAPFRPPHPSRTTRPTPPPRWNNVHQRSTPRSDEQLEAMRRYITRLSYAVELRGWLDEPPKRSGWWRTKPPSGRQLEVLRSLLTSLSSLPGGHGESLTTIFNHLNKIDRGMASDLLGVLLACKRRRTWPGTTADPIEEAYRD